MPRYRSGVGFVMDVSKHVTNLDRNQKARLIHACECMERRTKGKGRRNGVLGIPAMIVLRALLFRFHGASGACFPSYDAIQHVTGLCRQSIARAVANLEAAKVLTVTRRLVRFVDELGVRCVRQGSNLYGFTMPPARVDLWVVAGMLSLRRRQKSQHPYKKPTFDQAVVAAVKRASRGAIETAAADDVLRQFRLLRGYR
jgi:hypothetical protein